jgi:hypothetical protein
MSDEAAWKLGKAKYEEPGYVIVRKSKGVGDLRADLKVGLDGVAGEWIKLNKSDLGSGGAGGSYDDTALWKEIADLNDKVDNLDIPDTTDLATKNELAALQNQVTKDIADLKDHLDNHPSGGGDTTQIEEDIAKLQESVAGLETALETVEDGLAQEVQDRQEGDKALQDQIDVINTSGYDDTKVKEDIKANADAIAEIQTKGYDDTELRGLVQGNTDALADKSDTDHTHDDYLTASDLPDPYDDTELRGLISDEETARVEGDKDLQDQIDAINDTGYDDTKIREDFAEADQALQDQIDALDPFDPTALQEKDAEQDGRLDQIDLDQEAQDARLTALENQGGQDEIVVSGGQPYITLTSFSQPTNPGECTISNSSGQQMISFWTEDKNSEDFALWPASGDEFGFAVWDNGPDEDPTVILGTVDFIYGEGSGPTVGQMTLNLPDGETAITMIGGKEVLLGISLNPEAPEAFDPTYLEEKDAEQDDRLDALEKDVEEHLDTHGDYADKEEFETLQTDFETLQTEVEEHLTNHPSGSEEPDNVYQWTAGTSIRGDEDGKCEFVVESGRQKVLVALSDANGEEAPVLEIGDSMTIKQGDRKNTFDILVASTERNCKMYVGDYSDTNAFNSVPDEEATIIFGEEIFADHEHEDLEDRIAALEKEHGPTGPKKTFVTTTGQVNNSDGLIDLKPKMMDASVQWILLSHKDSNGDIFPHPKVGDPFTVELGDKTITGIVNFSQSNDIWMDTADGSVTTSGTNGDPVIAYIGIPREDDPVADHEHKEYADKTEFEELQQKVDDILDYTPGDVYEFTNVSYVYGNETALCKIQLDGTKQRVTVSGKDANGDSMPISEIGDKMTFVVGDNKNTFRVGQVNKLSNGGAQYWGPEDDDNAFNGLEASLLDQPAQVIFGDEPRSDFDATYLEEKDAEQDARLDDLEASVGVGDKFNFTTVSSLGRIDTEGAIYLTTSGGGKQLMYVNKKDNNGKDVPLPEVGDLVTLEVDGQTIYFPVGYSGNNGSFWSIDSADDYTDGIRLHEDGHDAALTFGGEEPYRFDPTYLEEKDAEQDERLDKIDVDQEAQNKRLNTLEEVAYRPVIGVWKRTDNANTSGGMIGVTMFNSVNTIHLNYKDVSGEAFDFTGIEVGTVLTITNTTNQDATGKYQVTKIEDKGITWTIQVDILEGEGVLNNNQNAEFSFGVLVEPLDTEKVVTVAEGQEGPLSIWRGTKAEYDAIATPSDEVLYIVLP